jgi:hypothetical protein
LAGQIRPVLLRQGHYFGHSLGGNAHAVKTSASHLVLASAIHLIGRVVSLRSRAATASLARSQPKV